MRMRIRMIKSMILSARLKSRQNQQQIRLLLDITLGRQSTVWGSCWYWTEAGHFWSTNLHNRKPPPHCTFPSKNSEQISWDSLMHPATADYKSLQFMSPHWNTFVDLTGDCLPDLVLLNVNNEIEIWIAEGHKFRRTHVIDHYSWQESVFVKWVIFHGVAGVGVQRYQYAL